MAMEALMMLCGVALVAGFIDAMAGGGGLLTLPALLTAGLSPAQALATNKLQGSCGTVAAVWAFWRAGHMDWRAMALPVFCVLLGAGGGAFLAQTLPPDELMALIPALLLGIALYFLFSPRASDLGAQARVGLPVFSWTAGLGIGFYDGFFGPGTGSFFAMACVALLGMGLRQATAQAKLLNCTSNVVSLAVFALGGKIVWTAGLAMAIGQILGGYWGARAALRFGARLMRPLLVTMCLAMTVRLAIKTNHPFYAFVVAWLGLTG
jgi:uncharacterized protein